MQPHVSGGGATNAIPPASNALLTAKASAALLSVSLSFFWKLVREGGLPKPVYLTARCPRWRQSELLAALENKR